MDWIFAHLIGDYLIQNDWMAKGKKTSSAICTVHIASYMLPFLFLGMRWWQLALIAAQHWIQDRTNIIPLFMRATGKGAFTSPPMAPWSIIVTDNIVHTLWIATVVSFGLTTDGF